MQLSIHIDGGSRGNPGPAAAAVVIRRVEPAGVIHEAGYFLGRLTNNVAEYHGLLRALGVATKLSAAEVEIHSDSELMVRQITGQYKVKSQDLQPLHEEAQRLLLKFDLWRIVHVPREQNRRADQLANMALDAKRDVIVKSALGEAPTPLLEAAGEDGAASGGGGGGEGGPCPRFTVQLLEPAGAACPAPPKAGEAFAFGPQTPAGLCVYAAEAALSAGPLEPGEIRNRRALTQCPRCGAAIRVELSE